MGGQPIQPGTRPQGAGMEQATIQTRVKMATLLAAALVLSGCGDFKMPSFGFGKKPATQTATPETSSVRLVERDVEDPLVFQVTEPALWDGRPSLGGVWVAYPGDIQPERVIIRNTENKKFVIGALFKRERDNPGPKIQLSSDAAAALGILAGKPTTLNVTALRRESVPQKTSEAEPVPTDPAKKKSVTDIAAAAIDEAEGKPEPEPLGTQPISTLAKPFIQIGIFSVETNARNTATSLATLGVVPIVKEQQSKGKTFWRVLIGPASSKSERAGLLKKAHQLGFDDAYFVTN